MDVIDVALRVPPLALAILKEVEAITGAARLCIGGGFPRGLYMRDTMGCKPQMNDIDIFVDLAVRDFERVRPLLTHAFDTPIRTHLGRFEDEEHPRGLIEFAVPEDRRAECGGVQSIQINFGEAHPWADPYDYVTKANLGINQIAIDTGGLSRATPLFLADMDTRTMTMNAARVWTHSDWKRTVSSMERMRSERPEFSGWRMAIIPMAPVPASGAFWTSRPSPRV